MWIRLLPAGSTVTEREGGRLELVVVDRESENENEYKVIGAEMIFLLEGSF